MHLRELIHDRESLRGADRVPGSGAVRILLWLLLTVLVNAPTAGGKMLGLPLSRTYSFEEIGNVSPAARLHVDELGRLMVVDQGSILVFDDINWNGEIDPNHVNRNAANIADAPDGRTYWGSDGSWGYLERTAEVLPNRWTRDRVNYVKGVIPWWGRLCGLCENGSFNSSEQRPQRRGGGKRFHEAWRLPATEAAWKQAGLRSPRAR